MTPDEMEGAAEEGASGQGVSREAHSTAATSRWRSITYGVLAAVLIVVLVPPAYGIARDLLFLARAEADYAEGVVASQLYTAFEERDARRYASQPYSHPYAFPYLECPPGEQQSEADFRRETIHSNQWSPEMGEYIITTAFIVENDARYRSLYVSLLIDRYSALKMIFLRSCIDSSFLSAECAAAVRNVTWGSYPNLDEGAAPVATDAMRAITFCRYYPAAVAYHRGEGDRQ